MKDFRGSVLRPARCDPLDEREAFPFELLQRHFLDCARHHHTIPQLLEIIHAIVTEQATYRRSLPLVEVVQLCKLVYVDHEEFPTVDGELASEGFSDAEILQILTQVERTLQEKILVTSLATGKLNRRQAEGVFLLVSMAPLLVLLIGGTSCSLAMNLEMMFAFQEFKLDYWNALRDSVLYWNSEKFVHRSTMRYLGAMMLT